MRFIRSLRRNINTNMRFSPLNPLNWFASSVIGYGVIAGNGVRSSGSTNIIQFVVGDAAVITGSFYSVPDNILVDSSLFNFVFESPDGTITTWDQNNSNIIYVSTGVYQVILPLTQSGAYLYHWVAGSPSMGVFQNQFIIIPSNI